MEMYTGTTDGAGVFSIVYSRPFINPMLLPLLVGGDSETAWRVTSDTQTGFSVKAERRGLLTVLGINLLSFAVTNASAMTMNVIVIEGG